MSDFPQLGSYEIDQQIAETATGAVYSAAHATDGRPVWIYTPKPEWVESYAIERELEKETGALAEIDHPAVPELIDKQIEPKSEAPVFLAFAREAERQWKPVSALLAGKKGLGAKTASAICRQTMSALGALHAGGVVHGDLTPRLIQCAQLADGGIEVRILGLGTRPMLEEKRRHAGFGAGPADESEDDLFRAPEAKGSSFSADPRMDVFSAAALTWTLLTGAAPPNPDQFDAGKLGNGVAGPFSSELAAVLEKAMSSISMLRHADVGALKDALEPVFDQMVATPAKNQLTSAAPATAAPATTPQAMTQTSTPEPAPAGNASPAAVHPSFGQPPAGQRQAPPSAQPRTSSPQRARAQRERATAGPATRGQPMVSYGKPSPIGGPRGQLGKSAAGGGGKKMIIAIAVGAGVLNLGIVLVVLMAGQDSAEMAPEVEEISQESVAQKPASAAQRPASAERKKLARQIAELRPKRLAAKQQAVAAARRSQSPFRKRFQKQKALYLMLKESRHDSRKAQLMKLAELACQHGFSDELAWVLNEADGPLRKKIQKKCAPTKKHLSRSDVVKVMRSLRNELRLCFKRHHSKNVILTKVKVSGRSGRVAAVEIPPPHAGKPVGRCVAQVLGKAVFPRFKAKDFVFSFPISSQL